MKNIIFILLFPLLLGFAGNTIGQVEPEEEVIITKPAEDSADLSTFYDELSKDGDWIKVEKDEIDNEENLELSETVEIDEDVITEYVWRPRVSYVYIDWNPYTYGHWVFTRFGWVWVSDYEWGWGPYHYGRWWFSVRWGWVWSPGHRWAPSWVSWCHTHHHIGWHPISPRTRWRHHHGVIITHPVTPRQKSITNKWTFVKKEDFTKKITREAVIDLKKDKHLITNAKITAKGNEVYNTGPKKKEIETITGTSINPKKVSLLTKNGTPVKNPTISPNESNTKLKKKNENIYKTRESNNTGEKQINKNTEPKNKRESTTTNPNTKRENTTTSPNTKREKTTTQPNTKRDNSNKNSTPKKESNKNSNTKKESNNNYYQKKESNSNTNTKKESNNNTTTKKETYKTPTYNPGNSNKNSSPNKETYKAPTHNPGSNNRDTYKAPSHNPGSNNSKSNNPGNSNKNSSPPPKKK